MSRIAIQLNPRLLIAALAVAFVCILGSISPPAAHAATTCTQIVEGFSSPHSQAGEDFAVRQATVRTGPGAVIFASDCAGTQPLNVNDGIKIDVTRPDGTTSSFSHDFSNGCSGGIQSAGPFDLTSNFAPGNNAITVHLQDICGQGGSSSHDVFVVYNGCSDIRVGQAVAQGCFNETAPGSGVFTTDQKAWVGGFEVQPRPGGRLVVDTTTPAVRSDGAGTDILLDGFTAPFGVERLPVTLSDASFDFNQSGTAEKLLLKLPVKGKAKASWSDGGTSASLEAELSLSALTGPLGKLLSLGGTLGEGEGKIKLKLTNGTGMVVSEAGAKIDEINVIPKFLKVPQVLKLKNVALGYQRKDNKPFWTGGALLELPLKNGPMAFGGRVSAFDGSLAGGGLTVDGINKEIPDTPLFLQRLDGDLLFRPDFGINVGVGATFGPRIGGKQIFSLDGNLKSGAQEFPVTPVSTDCKNGLDPGELDGSLKFSPLSAEEQAGIVKVDMNMRTCFYTGPIKAQDATVKGKIDFADNAVGYEGTESGFVGQSGFDLEGGVTLRLALLPDINGQAIISNQGLAACGTINFFQGGFAYRWGQRLPSTFTGCDLSPFRTTALPAGARAAAARTVRVPARLPHVAFAATSAAGAPRVKVTGPRGVTFSSPATGVLRSNRVVILPVEAEKTTYVIVNDPRPGRWRVESLDPNRPLSRVAIARGLPRPRVRAKLGGRGAKRTLAYTLVPLAGQKVEFFERGLGGVDRRLGRARGRRGTITFRPTLALRRRRAVVAEVTQDGFPRAEITVARFIAPGLPRLRKPKIKAKRTRSRLTLTWGRVAGARRYLVEINSGSTLVARVLATRTRVALGGTPATGKLTASIRALSDATGLGPIGRLTVKAPKR